MKFNLIKGTSGYTTNINSRKILKKMSKLNETTYYMHIMYLGSYGNLSLYLDGAVCRRIWNFPQTAHVYREYIWQIKHTIGTLAEH